ncbi:MAG: C40 family peptidase [Flammeovirgaceae bacterium]|nr:C40 family peptidase [Flammeovirgaceae bacterium]MDW8286768.1 NlpC/P60 family protein [Flammeovirgaceae bacterium]
MRVNCCLVFNNLQKRVVISTHRLFICLIVAIFLGSCQPAGRFSYKARKERLYQKNLMRLAKQGKIPVVDEKKAEEKTETTVNTEVSAKEDSKKYFVTESLRNKVLETAESYLGTPHKVGGMSYKGIDCSGLTAVSFASIGIDLPRTSSNQALMGTPVDIKNLQRADLVFF